MNFKIRALWAISSLVTVLMLGGTARANTITATVYTGFTDGSTVPIMPLFPGPGTKLSGTFIISGTLNFSSYGNAANVGNPDNSYKLGTFITSLGDTISTFVPANGGSLTDTVDNTLWDFHGTAFKLPGTITITHDDGIRVYINGVLLDGVGSPTGASTDSFFFPGGLFTYDVLYGEEDGAPGLLETDLANLGSAPIPEPSTLIMLGTGLVGIAGAVRRRLAR